mgnify:CR=1 FL=1
MKSEDFLKWGNFVFSVLHEVDKKFNFTNDEDVINYIEENNLENEAKKFKYLPINESDYDKHLIGM